MKFCLFARFLCVVCFCLQRFKLTNKIAFLAVFWPFSCVLLSFVCVCLYRQKSGYFWPFFALNFRCTPNPHGDPHRDRGCLPENFFLKIFSFHPQPSVCQPSKFFFRIFFLVFYLTTNSHFACHAIYFSENKEVFYLTAI